MKVAGSAQAMVKKHAGCNPWFWLFPTGPKDTGAPHVVRKKAREQLAFSLESVVVSPSIRCQVPGGYLS